MKHDSHGGAPESRWADHWFPTKHRRDASFARIYRMQRPAVIPGYDVCEEEAL